MTVQLNRRRFLFGLGAAVAAPLVVKAVSLMPIRGRVLLTEDVTYYVRPWGLVPDAISRSRGYRDIVCHAGHRCDANDGLPSVMDGSWDNPFRTIQSAVDYISDKLDLNGHHVTVDLANGFYKENLVMPKGEVTLGVDRGNFVEITGSHIKGFNERAPALEVRNNSYLRLDKIHMDYPHFELTEAEFRHREPTGLVRLEGTLESRDVDSYIKTCFDNHKIPRHPNYPNDTPDEQIAWADCVNKVVKGLFEVES